MEPDRIELHVYNDGDIVLTKRLMPEKGVLSYGMNQLGDLKAELISYGAEPEVVDRCIVEVLTGDYGEEVPVK